MDTSVQTEEILFSVEDGIGRVIFNRPAQRNALTWAMYEGLVAAVERADADEAIKALLIEGAGGKAFAAGTDIGQFRAFAGPEDALGYEHRMDAILSTLEACRKPTIAAIAGACTGGGAAIAACCDLRVAAEGSRFGFPIAKTLGNCLSMASLSRLVSLIGSARTKEMIFTARLVEAAEAKAIGLVHEVVAADAIGARGLELARTVAGHAPLTLLATKLGLRRLRPDVAKDEGLILMCYQSEDFREGMDAFLNKRPPHWRGV